MARSLLVFPALAAAALLAAEPDPDPFSEEVGVPHLLELPEGIPAPDLPADYPLTSERITLGRALFYDGVLSRNGRVMCGTCHQRRFAHADRRPFSAGINGQATTRNSMPIFNVAWKKEFFWDGRAPSLRAQVLMPIQDHREMDESLENVVRKLANRGVYRSAFEEAYGTPEVTAERIAVALEQFLVARTSFDSTFDRAACGEATLSEEEERGRVLFMTNHQPDSATTGAGCVNCHSGPFFTDHAFRNNGLKATDDLGREAVTGLAADHARFATPTLRNVALTAPYMHDGRFGTLAEVVAHYNSGVHRSPTLDPKLEAQAEHGLGLSDADQAALVAFLHTLTDPKFAAEHDAARRP